MRVAVLLSSVVLAFGCSAASPSEFEAIGGGAGVGNAGAGASGVGGSTFVGAGGGVSSGSSGSDCSDAAKLIYVLSDTNELYSFEPQKKKFTKIGTLGCNTAMSPNSMAVDRDATAWVNYVESDPFVGGDVAGAIFKVSTTDASCQATSISLGQGWYRLGMGFSVNEAGGDTETLFVAGTGDALGGGSKGLAKIDLTTNTLVPIGPFTGALAGASAELTGTGDARLFGFFTTIPVQVADINKTSGAILSATPLPAVPVPSAWAFSFWGGDFYLYTADSFSSSNVNHYQTLNGKTNTSYMTDIGFRIVGAGVSTCAPLTPPS